MAKNSGAAQRKRTRPGISRASGGRARFRTKTGDSLSLPDGVGAAEKNIVLRPQNITIQREAGRDALVGTVAHREFLGGQIRYLVTSGGSEIVVDQSHRSGRDWFEPGATVHLVANTENPVVL